MQKAFTFPWKSSKFCTSIFKSRLFRSTVSNVFIPRSSRSTVVNIFSPGCCFTFPKVKLSTLVNVGIGNNITKYDSEKVALQTEFNKYKDHHIDQAFFLANVGAAKRQYDQWIKELPRVVPFYAVKCNPDPVLVSTLHKRELNLMQLLLVR